MSKIMETIFTEDVPAIDDGWTAEKIRMQICDIFLSWPS